MNVLACTDLQQKRQSKILDRQLRYRMTEAGSDQLIGVKELQDLQANGSLLWEIPLPDADVYPNPWVRRQDAHVTAGPHRPIRGFREALGYRVTDTCSPEVEMQSLLATDRSPSDRERQEYISLSNNGANEKTVLPNDNITTVASPFHPLNAAGDSREPRQLSLLQIIRLNFVKYCESTSLRGVPKIVKTKESLLRKIWGAFVFVFFFGCLTCLTLIINQFLHFDVIHQPRKVSHKPVQFPSFTVCNTHPLSEEGIDSIKNLNLLLPKSYTNIVFNKVRNTAINLRNLKESFSDEVKDSFSTIFDSKGYYENVPDEIPFATFGHTLDQTVLFCESTIVMENFKKSMFCDYIGNWTRTYDSKFLNCYSFTANEHYTKKILTMRIMAYTNERKLTYCPDCTIFPATQVSGLRVQLHNAGNYPEVQTEGLNLKPGSLTEIRFDTKEWLMKEPPHGKCSRSIKPTMHFDRREFTYSYEACKKKQIQELIKQRCNCLDSTIPIPDDMNRTGITYCGRIPQEQFSMDQDAPVMKNQTSAAMLKAIKTFYNIKRLENVRLPSFLKTDKFNAFIQKIKCNMEVYKEVAQLNTQAKQDNCFRPCVYYTYDTTISTTNWPSKAYIFDMLSDFQNMKRRIDQVYHNGKTFRNSSYLTPILKKLNETYQPVLDVLNKEKNPDKALEKLKTVDYIENNFIEILINRGKSNFEIQRIEEKAVISLTSLLSQIGGLLSIWVGLTFVCIVEIIEMVYNIFSMYRSRRQV